MTALRAIVQTDDAELWSNGCRRDANQHVRALILAQHVVRKNAECRAAVQRVMRSTIHVEI
jgi:hypothetical protein